MNTEIVMVGYVEEDDHGGWGDNDGENNGDDPHFRWDPVRRIKR